jgi:phosphonate transport system ATP-binding protein
LGITVICNLHDLDIAREYCDRLVGMSDGRVVFDDVPEKFTETLVHDLYGIEANETTENFSPNLNVPMVATPSLQASLP